MLSKILPVINQMPDIFHIQWAKSLPYWFFLKEIFGVKIVLSLRGSHINYSADADELLASQYRYLFPKIDQMHAVSKKLVSKAEKFGADSKKIEVIYSPLDMELLQKYKKTNFNIHHPFRFLSVGRFHWVKGYHYSISAIKELIQKNKSVHYTILSNSSPSEEILYQINDLSLKSKVKFLNPLNQEDVYQEMKAADCLILPSVEEGLANVVLESMAIGLPVISSDCGGMKEVISYGENGFLFSNRNVDSLQTVLLKIMELGIKERKKIIISAWKHIQKEFDPDNIQHNFYKLYKKTMEIKN